MRRRFKIAFVRLTVLAILAWPILPTLGVWAVAYAVNKELEKRKKR